jgi:hypothetical protein
MDTHQSVFLKCFRQHKQQPHQNLKRVGNISYSPVGMAAVLFKLQNKLYEPRNTLDYGAQGYTGLFAAALHREFEIHPSDGELFHFLTIFASISLMRA